MESLQMTKGIGDKIVEAIRATSNCLAALQVVDKAGNCA